MDTVSRRGWWSSHARFPAFTGIGLSAAHPCQASAFQAHTVQLRRPQCLQSAWKLQATCAIITSTGHYMLRARGHQIASTSAFICICMSHCAARKVCIIRRACARYNRRSRGRGLPPGNGLSQCSSALGSAGKRSCCSAP